MIEVKAGYKQTEIGVIPEDWEVFNLDKLSDRIGDGIHSTPKYSTDGDYFFINGNNLNNGIIEITVDTKRVSKDEYHIHKREINNTTVLLSINGTIGNIAFYNNENIILGKSAAYINLNNGIDKRYLYQIIQTEFIKKYFDNELTGSTIKNLGLGSIRNSPIPLPPSKSEQTAIANVLSDTDALIERLEKLIAKKIAIKQGAMQQLLTGKKRLPGFEQKKSYKRTELGVMPEDWEIKEIGNISDVDPDNLGSSTNPDYAFKYISLEDVDCGILRNYAELMFKNAPSRARRKIQHGDILISTVRPNLKSHLLVRDQVRDFICSTGFSVVRCKDCNTNSEYIFNHFFASIINKQIDNLITGSNYPAISSKDVKALLIPIPPSIEEQNAIATILSDMDTEIESLEQKRDKYTMIKQGMMQQLLTGRIRIHGTN